ncbi:MAG: DoxX family protein [Myxococcales bacterium]|nr:DoxX family protein [Myxococcales bacterium]
MRWLTWSGMDRYRDLGMLVVRVGLGAMIMGHGWPKVAGGAAVWERLGGAMGHLGVTFAPTFWGAAAAFTEFFGGALIVLGLGTRPIAALLVFVLFVAALGDFNGGAAFRNLSHPVETGLAFLALFFAGPGSFSLDGRLRKAG